jgi:hypothetical protein
MTPQQKTYIRNLTKNVYKTLQSTVNTDFFIFRKLLIFIVKL